MLTKAEGKIMRDAIYAVWQQIGHDVLACCDADDNEGLVEMCIDADRLVCFGEHEAAALLNTILKDNSYPAVLTELSSLISLGA